MSEWVDLLEDDYATPKEDSKVEFVTGKAAFEDGYFKDGRFFVYQSFMEREYKNEFKPCQVNCWRYR